MKKFCAIFLTFALLLTAGCASGPSVSPDLYVKKVENLSDDFLMGADVSSLISLENSGVVFYDFDGNEADLLSVLADAGINAIRVRVWVDPYDAQGNGYGGGNCDLDTAIAIGTRAARYGMQLLVDFHYSDFWADPSKQQAPKAWSDMTLENKMQAVCDYTTDSLTKLRDAGVNVAMVQIGNETNNGFAGEDAIPAQYKLMARAAEAVRQVDPEIQIVVHYTNPEAQNYSFYAATLELYGVDYDIFSTSYYPYWHGTLENLTEQLDAVIERSGKQVMVAETSWAYTVEDTDGHANSIGDQPNYDKPYPFTVQGQANEIADVIEAVASLGQSGVGVFYWEPAWISVPGEATEERAPLWEQFGSGWASSYSAQYDPDDAGQYYGGSACDNQALFDADGHPLESLKVFSYVRTGTAVARAVDSVEPVYLTVKKNNEITLPQTVDAIYNDGSIGETAVDWDKNTDLAAIAASDIGSYPVHGTADGRDVICYIQIVDENYVENYSFEDDDLSMWQIGGENPNAADIQEKTTDAFSGKKSLHFWSSSDYAFTAQQEITDLRSGNYTFSIEAQGGDFSDDAELTIYVISDGIRYENRFLLTGWCEWCNPIISDIPCESGSMTVGVSIRANAGSWGTVDDFLLNPNN